MANAHLNLEERIELEAALRAGDTQAIIAIRLARSAGTISRELEACLRRHHRRRKPRRRGVAGGASPLLTANYRTWC